MIKTPKLFLFLLCLPIHLMVSEGSELRCDYDNRALPLAFFVGDFWDDRPICEMVGASETYTLSLWSIGPALYSNQIDNIRLKCSSDNPEGTYHGVKLEAGFDLSAVLSIDSGLEGTEGGVALLVGRKGVCTLTFSGRGFGAALTIPHLKITRDQ